MLTQIHTQKLNLVSGHLAIYFLAIDEVSDHKCGYLGTVCIRHQWARPISDIGVSPQFDSVSSELYLSRVLSPTGKRTMYIVLYICATSQYSGHSFSPSW